MTFVTSNDILVLLYYAHVFIWKCLKQSAIFNCDVINGVAATRATKMVLVTVSSTRGYIHNHL